MTTVVLQSAYRYSHDDRFHEGSQGVTQALYHYMANIVTANIAITRVVRYLLAADV